MKYVQINRKNAKQGMLKKYSEQIFSNTIWHKFEISNALKWNRDLILRTIMKFVHPLDFIPVHYKIQGNNVTFLMKDCGDVIRKLCTNRMTVPNPKCHTRPFRISIYLNFASIADVKVNIQPTIMRILHNRHDPDISLLNLKSFGDDPELQHFFDLAQPKLLFYVLHLSKSFNIKTLRLSNNEIEFLQPLEALHTVKSLTTLDLRNNKIKRTEIIHLKVLKLTDLWLDGNPVCASYDAFTYSRTMKEVICTLERLDGVDIPPKGFPKFRRNFLCTLTRQDFVDQFLEHYFTLYDSPHRSSLKDIYHQSAQFSMTSAYLPQQSTSLSARLMPYKKYSRNIKMMSDFSKNDDYLFRGSNIIKLLEILPISEHDPLTFNVDLMSYTENANQRSSAVLVVSGVFREPSDFSHQAEHLLGFSRMFVLLGGENGEYKIINEQFHVTNASATQAAQAFKQSRVPKSWAINIPKSQNLKEQIQITEVFSVLTGLTTEWATKYLEECQYDLKEALTLFLKFFNVSLKNNMIEDRLPT